MGKKRTRKKKGSPRKNSPKKLSEKQLQDKRHKLQQKYLKLQANLARMEMQVWDTYYERNFEAAFGLHDQYMELEKEFLNCQHVLENIPKGMDFPIAVTEATVQSIAQRTLRKFGEGETAKTTRAFMAIEIKALQARLLNYLVELMYAQSLLRKYNDLTCEYKEKKSELVRLLNTDSAAIFGGGNDVRLQDVGKGHSTRTANKLYDQLDKIQRSKNTIDRAREKRLAKMKRLRNQIEGDLVLLSSAQRQHFIGFFSIEFPEGSSAPTYHQFSPLVINRQPAVATDASSASTASTEDLFSLLVGRNEAAHARLDRGEDEDLVPMWEQPFCDDNQLVHRSIPIPKGQQIDMDRCYGCEEVIEITADGKVRQHFELGHFHYQAENLWYLAVLEIETYLNVYQGGAEEVVIHFIQPTAETDEAYPVAIEVFTPCGGGVYSYDIQMLSRGAPWAVLALLDQGSTSGFFRLTAADGCVPLPHHCMEQYGDPEDNRFILKAVGAEKLEASALLTEAQIESHQAILCAAMVADLKRNAWKVRFDQLVAQQTAKDVPSVCAENDSDITKIEKFTVAASYVSTQMVTQKAVYQKLLGESVAPALQKLTPKQHQQINGYYAVTYDPVFGYNAYIFQVGPHRVFRVQPLAFNVEHTAESELPAGGEVVFSVMNQSVFPAPFSLSYHLSNLLPNLCYNSIGAYMRVEFKKAEEVYIEAVRANLEESKCEGCKQIVIYVSNESGQFVRRVQEMPAVLPEELLTKVLDNQLHGLWRMTSQGHFAAVPYTKMQGVSGAKGMYLKVVQPNTAGMRATPTPVEEEKGCAEKKAVNALEHTQNLAL